ncbi:quercetin 2,3-dioxygenase [Sarotherodon galilaeus]
MVVANQPDTVVLDKQRKTAIVVDVAIPSDSNIRKKEHEKLKKYQGLREELEKMWRVKLQQIPGTTSEISVQKSAVLGTAKTLRRTPKLPGLPNMKDIRSPGRFQGDLMPASAAPWRLSCLKVAEVWTPDAAITIPAVCPGQSCL